MTMLNDETALNEFRIKAEELLDRASGLFQSQGPDTIEVARIITILKRAGEMMGLKSFQAHLLNILELLGKRPTGDSDRTPWEMRMLSETSDCRISLYEDPESAARVVPPLENTLAQTHPAAPRVLVVDDDQDLVDLISDQLLSAGYEVMGLERPESALDAITTFQPQLVISDFSMPKMSGLDLILQIRQTFADLPVIVLSGALDKDKLMSLMPTRLIATLEKPWDKEHFLGICQSAVGTPRPLQLLSRALDIILGQLALAPATPEQVPELQKEITQLFEECLRLGLEDAKEKKQAS